MSSKEEFHKQINSLTGDNMTGDFGTIHFYLHEGNYKAAEGWAEDIGLNGPPVSGRHLRDEEKEFLKETLDTHKPGDSGLPDHDF